MIFIYYICYIYLANFKITFSLLAAEILQECFTSPLSRESHAVGLPKAGSKGEPCLENFKTIIKLGVDLLFMVTILCNSKQCK